MTAVHRLPGLLLTDHELSVPLDHDRPDGERIMVYAREVVAPSKQGAGLPWLLYLQGGPGGKSPRPAKRGDWLARALREYRVLLLDQRGTGRSTPATRQTLARLGGQEAQADYLRHFRADAIVADAELLRRELAGPDEPWSLLGQSYGGFCVTAYLSRHPEGVREAFVAGGLPPLTAGPDDVYRATFQRVLDRNRRYDERYPEDAELVRRIADLLLERQERLPSGDPLTVPRLQQLGMAFGMSDGFERVHYLLEEAFADGPAGRELSDTFLMGVEQAVTFATSPLYAVLHEPIYCQGQASRWSAERIRAEHPRFDATAGEQVLFTGEMVFPWMFEVDGALRPLQRAAQLLAEVSDWPALYDPDRLARNTVPVAAVIYDDDMYVERAFSEQTANGVPGVRTWVTSEYDHDGLRVAGGKILDRLIDLARGEA